MARPRPGGTRPATARHCAVCEIELAQCAAPDLYRRLAEGDLVQYEPRVAAVLGNFEALTENGRPEEALRENAEAVAIRRRLAKENERGTRPDLAGALSALGALYSTTGRADESLRLEREALEIRRELAREHLDRYLHYLAHSLSDHGVAGPGARPLQPGQRAERGR